MLDLHHRQWFHKLFHSDRFLLNCSVQQQIKWGSFAICKGPWRLYSLACHPHARKYSGFSVSPPSHPLTLSLLSLSLFLKISLCRSCIRSYGICTCLEIKNRCEEFEKIMLLNQFIIPTIRNSSWKIMGDLSSHHSST